MNLGTHELAERTVRELRHISGIAKLSGLPNVATAAESLADEWARRMLQDPKPTRWATQSKH